MTLITELYRIPVGFNMHSVCVCLGIWVLVCVGLRVSVYVFAHVCMCLRVLMCVSARTRKGRGERARSQIRWQLLFQKLCPCREGSINCFSMAESSPAGRPQRA